MSLISKRSALEQMEEENQGRIN